VRSLLAMTRPLRNPGTHPHPALPSDAPCAVADVAVRWTLHTEPGPNRQRLTVADDRGVLITDFPLSDFSAAYIRENWGVGVFRVTFYDREKRMRGNRVIQIIAPPAKNTPVPVPAPEPPPPVVQPSPLVSTTAPSSPPGVGTFEDSLRHMQLIQQMAAQQTNTMFGAIERILSGVGIAHQTQQAQQAQQGQAQITQVLAAMVQSQQTTNALLARLADRLPSDDGDDEGEEVDAPRVETFPGGNA
jgi:hypothetical protein